MENSFLSLISKMVLMNINSRACTKFKHFLTQLRRIAFFRQEHYRQGTSLSLEVIMASLECSTESVASWSVRFIMEVVYRLSFVCIDVLLMSYSSGPARTGC